MTKFLLLVSATSSIFIVRVIASAIFVGVQWVVLRAFLRILRSVGLGEQREKLAVGSAVGLFALVNAPLLWFVIETFVSPRSFLLYAPPPGHERIVRPFAYLFFIWMTGSFFFAAAAPIAMSVYAAAQFFRRKRSSDKSYTLAPVDLSRRRFMRVLLLAAASMPFAMSAYGAVAARSRKVVERVVIPIAGLPEPLDGFTIVQISDIHAGFFMKEAAMREYVEIANALEPDVVALTGDFVATNESQVGPFMRAMAGLRARRGVLGCLGNHDMFTGSEEELERQFAAAGFKLLRSASERIEVNGALLNVIGVDFIGGGSRDLTLEQALRGIPLDGTTVLLLHAPYAFPNAAAKGIHLTLSGHTHGGQIALTLGDMILTPARLSTVFLAGLYKIGQSHLYVNRGLGTTGPPIRLGAPPEITHLTLKAV
jgi:predicted MPP superfamily phosphohydrolase